MNKLGKRFRVNYNGHISKYKYKIVYVGEHDIYIIGFDKDKVCAEDLKYIKGWISDEYDDKECNRFWCIGEGNLIKEYMSIE